VSGEWPHAKLDGPISAQYAQAIAARLREVIDEQQLTLRAAARLSGIDRQTITRVLNGEHLADIGTVAALEQALDADLWPRRDGHILTSGRHTVTRQTDRNHT
jgi:transcriptional regulator with XRE-family HTH domain